MCLGIPDKPVSGCEQPAGSVGRSSGSDGPHCPSPGPSASHTAHSWGSVRRALKDTTLLRLQGETKDKAAAFHSPSRAFQPFAEAGPPLEKPVGTVRPGGFLHTRRCCPEALSLREASVPSCCQPHARPDATVKTGAGAGFARAGLGGHVGRGFHLSADHGGGSEASFDPTGVSPADTSRLYLAAEGACLLCIWHSASPARLPVPYFLLADI